MPAGLLPTLLKVRNGQGAERGLAAAGTLRLIDGYARCGPWLSEDQIFTRLGEATTRLRLAVIREGTVVPWAVGRAEARDPRRLWALSEVSVRGMYISGAPEPLTHAIEVAKRDWPSWERDRVPIVLLEPSEQIWRGHVRAPNGSLRQITYSPLRGLTI